MSLVNFHLQADVLVLICLVQCLDEVCGRVVFAAPVSCLENVINFVLMQTGHWETFEHLLDRVRQVLVRSFPLLVPCSSNHGRGKLLHPLRLRLLIVPIKYHSRGVGLWGARRCSCHLLRRVEYHGLLGEVELLGGHHEVRGSTLSTHILALHLLPCGLARVHANANGTFVLVQPVDLLFSN